MRPKMFGAVFLLSVSSHPARILRPLTLVRPPQTCFAAFGGILFGYDTGIIAGVQSMQDWLCVFGKADPTTGVCAITSSQQSLVVSILSAGTFFGALLAAPTADFLGRRWSVVLAVIIFCAGVAMQTAATALPLFVVGRVFAGLGVGMVSMLIPMYQSECSPKWIRSVSLHLACHACHRSLTRAIIKQRCRRLLLPMGDHYWPPPLRHHQQRHQG